jgi:hypothetical protein
MQQASDSKIYEAARNRNAVIITKDTDFLNLYTQLGVQPNLLMAILLLHNASKKYSLYTSPKPYQKIIWLGFQGIEKYFVGFVIFGGGVHYDSRSLDVEIAW